MSKLEFLEVQDFSKHCRACLSTEDINPLNSSSIILLTFKKLTDTETNNDDEFPKSFCTSCVKQIEEVNNCIETWKDNDNFLKNNTVLIKEESYSFLIQPETPFDDFETKHEDEVSYEIKIETKHRNPKSKTEFTCDVCLITFPKKKELILHTKSHVPKKRFICEVCQRPFAQSGTLGRHLLTHSGAKPFKCNNCGKTTSRKDLINDHISKHHPDDLNCGFTVTENNVQKREKEEIPKYQNENDNIELIKIKVQNDESKIPQKKKPDHKLTCSLCGKVFKRADYLQKHVDRLHAKIMPYKCNFCEKEFAHKNAYSRHILTHTKERPFQCNICGNTYIRKEMFAEHLKNHELGDKPYLCSHCGKSFSHKYGLSKHMKYVKDKAKNVDNPDCKCQICGKQFLIASHLKSHIIVHTGEKPFVCSKCGARFTVKRCLRDHMSIHDGVKPFQCLHCDKLFRTRAALRKHSLLHSGKRTHQCSQCPKAFFTARSLKEHERRHTGDIPFSCTTCHKKFFQRNHLQRHLRTHNNDI